MSQQNFYANYVQLIQAIEHCEDNNLLTPALVLLYSAIDSVSWLASGIHKESGRAFRTWVNEWMLSDPEIKCTADELYAARCGMVHTLTPTSNLSKKGIRKVAYSWGKVSNDDIEKLIHESGSGAELVSVHLSKLIQAFRNGMADYLEYVHLDPERMEIFQQKCGEHFASVSRDSMDEALGHIRSLNP